MGYESPTSFKEDIFSTAASEEDEKVKKTLLEGGTRFHGIPSIEQNRDLVIEKPPNEAAFTAPAQQGSIIPMDWPRASVTLFWMGILPLSFVCSVVVYRACGGANYLFVGNYLIGLSRPMGKDYTSHRDQR